MRKENFKPQIPNSKEEHFPEDTHAPKLQTSNSKLQTNMEVHKHPHHVTHKKKGGEYLLEFLMIFLAVFLGFVAENIREDVVDKHKERQYMQSLLNDLVADTAMLTRGIQRKEQRINAIDTVFMFFKVHPDVKTISGKFFRTLRRTTFDQLLIRNTITINQLKNAGGMRLISNKNTSEAIVENVPDSMVIRINNAELNDELNFMMQLKIFARQESNRFKDILNIAVNLMALIKKEYHLENE